MTPKATLNGEKKRKLAKLIHESRMSYCWPNSMSHNQPWPEKLPGDFGYIPQPWVDIAFAQAEAIIGAFDVRTL